MSCPLSATTNATVSLTANNVNSAEYCYTVDLIISSNNFAYSVNSSTPELTFNLAKNSINIISNRDITTTTGTIKIPTIAGGSVYIHHITAAADATVVDTIVPTVNFINLGTNQRLNEDKSLSAVLQFTKVDNT